MFTVHHVFPDTGEWAAITVNTLHEAELWYACKSKAKNIISCTITLLDNDNNIIKQEIIGK